MDKLTRWMRELRIERVEVSPDEARLHLAAFLDAFVIPSWRQRAHRLLAHGYWFQVTGRIEQHLDPALCRLDDAHSRPAVWAPPFAGEGLYVTTNDCLRMQVEQASLLSARVCNDVVFSLARGERAVWFNHDWGVWRCALAWPR